MTERTTTPREFDTSDGPQSQPAPAPAYMSDLEAERAPVHERQPFCVQCGLVDKIDHSDGACGYCGGDTCGLDQLRSLLAAQGLAVVSAAAADRVHTCADERIAELEKANADLLADYAQECTKRDAAEARAAAAEAGKTTTPALANGGAASAGAGTPQSSDERVVYVAKEGPTVTGVTTVTGVRLGGLRKALASQGLHVVTAADKAELDAAALMRFSNDGCDCIEIDDDGGVPEAELARREGL